MDKFEKTIKSFGNKEEQEKVELRFKWLGDPGYLHYVKSTCGCSDAFFDKASSEVVAILDLTRVGAKEGTPMVVNKYITVGLDPNIPDQITDEQLRIKMNPDKSRINLQMTGTLYSS